METHNPGIIERTLSALSLCKNLTSMTWIDDIQSSPGLLLAFLEVVRKLPLRSLTIRTHEGLGEEVWRKIMSLDGLTKVALLCMEGPPQSVLQSQPVLLGKTLTHFELGVCAIPYPLSELLAMFPHLQYLRLKGTPTTEISPIIMHLPNLQALDTEYFLPGSGAYYSHPTPRVTDNMSRKPEPSTSQSPLLPTLKHLTIRSRSMSPLSAQRLWVWVQDTLVPRAGLETFHLHAFAYSFVSSPTSSKGGNTYMFAGGAGDRSPSLSPHPFETWSTSISVPKRFLLNLGVRHGATLREFVVGQAQLTLTDMQCMCAFFKRLEVLECAVYSPDVDSIARSVASAKELKTLKLRVCWSRMNVEEQSSIIPVGQSIRYSSPVTEKISIDPNWNRALVVGDDMFTAKDANRMMRHSEDTKLRKISINRVQYTGRWVLSKESYEMNHKAAEPGSNLQFAIYAEPADDRWNT